MGEAGDGVAEPAEAEREDVRFLAAIQSSGTALRVSQAGMEKAVLEEEVGKMKDGAGLEGEAGSAEGVILQRVPEEEPFRHEAVVEAALGEEEEGGGIVLERVSSEREFVINSEAEAEGEAEAAGACDLGLEAELENPDVVDGGSDGGDVLEGVILARSPADGDFVSEVLVEQENGKDLYGNQIVMERVVEDPFQITLGADEGASAMELDSTVDSELGGIKADDKTERKRPREETEEVREPGDVEEMVVDAITGGQDDVGDGEKDSSKRVKQHATEIDGSASKDNRVQTPENGSCAPGEKTDIVSPEGGAKKDEQAECKPRRFKKRKVALIVAYSGVGYQGMQRNPGAITIEGELEEALFRAGAIAESNFGDPKKVDWMRAARTDKGVSAVGQVVSGKFFIDPPGLVERVNSHLPKQIRVLGYKRVIHTFSAKNLCDRRRYEYVLPVFAFDPRAHQYEENALVDEKGLVQDAAHGGVESTLNGAASVHVDPKETATKSGAVDGSAEIGGSNCSEPKISLAVAAALAPEGGSTVLQVAKAELGTAEVDQLGAPVCQSNGMPCSKESPFKFDEEVRNRLNSILQNYVGTHNFHNFTSRTKAEDPSARRYIVSFEADKVFEVDGLEFVSCVVVGQSFMLHQIRKMIGLAVAVMRNCLPISVFETALSKDVNFNVPMAPEVGLFLDECMYPAYNSRFYGTHEEVSLKDYKKEIDDFKQEFIYKQIARAEVKDQVVALWLQSLNDRNFPHFVSAREQGS